MKPIYTQKQARALIRFSGNGRPARCAIFHLKDGGPWEEALTAGGRDNKGRYYLTWCCPAKFEVTVGSLQEIVKILALGPKQASRAIVKGLQSATKNLGIHLARIEGWSA